MILIYLVILPNTSDIELYIYTIAEKDSKLGSMIKVIVAQQIVCGPGIKDKTKTKDD